MLALRVTMGLPAVNQNRLWVRFLEVEQVFDEIDHFRVMSFFRDSSVRPSYELDEF
jgi:hypothetical protein